MRASEPAIFVWSGPFLSHLLIILPKYCITRGLKPLLLLRTNDHLNRLLTHSLTQDMLPPPLLLLLLLLLHAMSTSRLLSRTKYYQSINLLYLPTHPINKTSSIPISSYLVFFSEL
ncbi:hypothetical protein BDR22DRAFT_386573 [Usnea florida]